MARSAPDNGSDFYATVFGSRPVLTIELATMMADYDCDSHSDIDLAPRRLPQSVYLDATPADGESSASRWPGQLEIHPGRRCMHVPSQ